MYAGLRASGKKPDLALVTCDVEAVAAGPMLAFFLSLHLVFRRKKFLTFLFVNISGVFTMNVVAAAPVVYCKKVLETSKTVILYLITWISDFRPRHFVLLCFESFKF